MFEQVFDNLRRATEATVQMQQELFKKWVKFWPGVPGAPPAWGDEVQQFQKKWGEAVGEMFKRQRDFTQAQFQAGLENIEKAFCLGEAKSVEELRAKTTELWKACFESLRKAYEAQIHEFQAAAQKWVELTTPAPV
jgi:hypothetical protein